MISLNYPIRCLSVSPGFVDVGLGLEASSKLKRCWENHGTLKSQDEIQQDLLSKTLTKQSASPTEVADLVDYVLSEKGRYLNGCELLIDNGLTL